MACNTLTGVAKSCDPNVKGIKRIYIAEHTEVLSVTATNGNITAINMQASPAGLFYTYEFRKTSGSMYDETQIDPSQGFDGWTQTVTLVLNRREVSKRNEIAVLAEGFRDLAVIVEDNNGIFWYFGEENGLNLTATTGGSEAANYTLTLLGEEPSQALTVDPAAVLAVLA